MSDTRVRARQRAGVAFDLSGTGQLRPDTAREDREGGEDRRREAEERRAQASYEARHRLPAGSYGRLAPEVVERATAEARRAGARRWLDGGAADLASLTDHYEDPRAGAQAVTPLTVVLDAARRRVDDPTTEASVTGLFPIEWVALGALRGWAASARELAGLRVRLDQLAREVDGLKPLLTEVRGQGGPAGGGQGHGGEAGSWEEERRRTWREAKAAYRDRARAKAAQEAGSS